MRIVDAELNAINGGSIQLLLCKEDAVVFTPACAALAFRSSHRRGIAMLLGLALALASYVALRAWALGPLVPEIGHPRHFHIPAEGQPGNTVFGLAALDPECLGRISEGELLDPDSRFFGHEKMPQFVHEHQHAQDKQKG